MSRFVIVDDVDPQIQYNGPWFSNQGGEDSVGNFGPPYLDTLHGANSDASLSFEFSGTRVIVVGSNNIRNDSGVLDPTWQCSIDNIGVSSTTPFAFPENNWVFCDHSGLLDGPHTLTVNATVSKNQTFWFDNIQYIPSASVPLDQAAIMIDNTDPQLQFGQGWGALGGTANLTSVPGSIFSFNFIGVSLSWYGYIPVELPFGSSPATYSIDGQTPINFLLKGLPPNSTTTIYNQKFFQTATLSPGSHSLEVVYHGNNSTPLVYVDIIVQNGTVLSTTTTLSSQSTGTSVTGTGALSTSTSTSTPGMNSTPVGAIVGGVIGGLALITFIILGFILLRRRRKHAVEEKTPISMPRPFDYSPLHPSSTTPELLGGGSSSRAQQTTQTGSAVTYGKVHTYHASIPSVTNTDVSQSIEPPSTSSGVTTHPANLRAVPFQQAALAVTNPSSFSPPVSVSSVPSKEAREAEALAAIRPQRRGDTMSPSNDILPPNVVLHADSGIRMPSGIVSDIPPIYTPD